MMAAASVKISFKSLQRFVTEYLRKDIARTGSILHSKLVALPLNARRLRISTIITSTLVASRGIGFWSGSKPETQDSTMAEKDAQSGPDAELMEEADRLYQSHKPLELYDFLIKHKDCNNEEVLWRLCRACRDKAQMSVTSTTDKKKLTYDALEYAKRCLEINDKNYASHKWYAICISEVGDYEGTKKKVANAYIIRDHFLKAIELKPNDATCYHLMGLWCFTFADMPWYQRKIATAIFGTPPTSTYEEALGHFSKAENINPGFYSKNLLMLGKTYSRMKDKKMALLYLTKARDYPTQKDEDIRAVQEAKQLLSELGVKQ